MLVDKSHERNPYVPTSNSQAVSCSANLINFALATSAHFSCVLTPAAKASFCHSRRGNPEESASPPPPARGQKAWTVFLGFRVLKAKSSSITWCSRERGVRGAKYTKLVKSYLVKGKDEPRRHLGGTRASPLFCAESFVHSCQALLTLFALLPPSQFTTSLPW